MNLNRIVRIRTLHGDRRTTTGHRSQATPCSALKIGDHILFLLFLSSYNNVILIYGVDQHGLLNPRSTSHHRQFCDRQVIPRADLLKKNLEFASHPFSLDFLSFSAFRASSHRFYHFTFDFLPPCFNIPTCSAKKPLSAGLSPTQEHSQPEWSARSSSAPSLVNLVAVQLHQGNCTITAVPEASAYLFDYLVWAQCVQAMAL